MLVTPDRLSHRSSPRRTTSTVRPRTEAAYAGPHMRKPPLRERRAFLVP
jgi:hypothetical protein